MYRISLCDDTAADLLQMENYIVGSTEFSSDMEITKYSSGIDYLETYKEAPDLLILDMQMAGLDGYRTAKEVRTSNEQTVIAFCSSVCMPAPEHFTVQPYRYILKNADKKVVQNAVDDLLIEMKRRKKQVSVEACMDGRVTKIDAGDILYISKIKRGLEIHLSEKSSLYGSMEELTSKSKMEEYETILCEEGFGMPHMSYLVNLKRIKAVNGMEIIMENGESLPISRSMKEKFHSQLSVFFSNKYKRSRNGGAEQ